MDFDEALRLSNAAIQRTAPRRVKALSVPFTAMLADHGGLEMARDEMDMTRSIVEPLEPDTIPEPNAGFGASFASGQWRVAIRAWTQRDLEHPSTAWLIDQARGEVDVQVTGVIRAGAAGKGRGPAAYRKVCRPLRAGYSVGHHLVSAGTLGAWVERTSDGTLLMLSNNHILANVNAAKKGDPIVQPGKLDDAGGKGGKVGTLEKYVRLLRRGNLVDAATARVEPGLEPDDLTLPQIGAVKGSYTCPLAELADLRVQKVGRESGLRRGKVQSVVQNLAVEFEIGGTVQTYRFNDVLEIVGESGTALGDHGDSGALVLDRDAYAVGLLFAGDGVRTFANPIEGVLDALGVELIRP